MQKLLVAGTVILGLFLTGCHDSSKEKVVEERPMNSSSARNLPAKESVRINETYKEGTGPGEVTIVKKEVQSGPVMLKARHRDIEISSKYTKCVKSGRSDCLLIREVGQEKWKASARVIDGFNYEPGYHYLVRVKEKLDENNVPRWKLVKIINRQQDK